MTGTLINVSTVLVGTAIGTTVGARLSEGLQQRVMAGLGLITLVIGVELALAWSGESTTRHTSLYVLGGVLIGGALGEVIGIERRLEDFGQFVQRRLTSGDANSRVAEALQPAFDADELPDKPPEEDAAENVERARVPPREREVDADDQRDQAEAGHHPLLEALGQAAAHERADQRAGEHRADVDERAGHARG